MSTDKLICRRIQVLSSVLLADTNGCSCDGSFLADTGYMLTATRDISGIADTTCIRDVSGVNAALSVTVEALGLEHSRQYCILILSFSFIRPQMFWPVKRYVSARF